MAKVKLRATGGLNKDLDPNFLPEGDYIEASNIVIDTSTSGNSGSIKMLESIKATGVSFSGTIKATCQDPDGNIYVLERTDIDTSTIYKLYTTTNPIDTKSSAILSYDHEAAPADSFIPDLRILGDVIMWNYEGEGVPLSYNLNAAIVSTDVNNFKLQKQTPSLNDVATIVKHKTSGDGVYVLESSDFQFCFRYVFETGEYSALSSFSQVFKAEPDTDYYTITYSFTNAPAYVDKIETFVRVGNSGAWRRIDKRTNQENIDNGALEWKGASYEALDTVTANKLFDSVPVTAKHLEVAKNRLFLANVQDDYEVTDASRKLQITTSNGYTPSTSLGDSISYLNASLVTASSSETTTGATYTKPFANNSSYAVGIAYYDGAMKTTGVEYFDTIRTSDFALPVLPDISIVPQTGFSKPSWAKYMQLVYTKNLDKIYIYEGYASNIFFEVTRTEKDDITNEDVDKRIFIQNLDVNDLGNNPVLVVDAMTMWSGGHIYNYTPGDIINVNVVNYTTSTETRLTLNVIKNIGPHIYCEYNGSEINTAGSLGMPEPDRMYFEIYTPRQQQETESYVFYEYGNIINIENWDNTSTITLAGANALGSKIIGDMVWKVVEGGTYQTRPFLASYVKKEPEEDNIDDDQITIVTGGVSNMIISASSPIPNFKTKTAENNIPFTLTSSTNSYESVIDNVLQVTGFYDAGIQDQGVNTFNLAFSYTYDNTLTIPTSTQTEIYSGSLEWKLKAQLYRIPYDNDLNKRLAAEKYGKEILVAKNSINSTVSATGVTGNYGEVFDLNVEGVDIVPNDQFTVKTWVELQTGGDVSAASVDVDISLTMTLKGNRIDSKFSTVKDPNAKINETKTKFLVRAVSNAIENPIWNTSSGKPSLSATDVISTVRTNTVRYSGQYIAGTKINNLNSFFALDSNDLPVENGEIMALHRASRLQGNGDMLLALCKRESSYILLGEQDITQASNAPLRALTANFIGTIRNVGGNLGLQEKLSAINYKGTIYWWDDFNKKVVKFSKDGIEIISDVYMKSYFRGKSGSARLCYDPFYNIINIGFTSDSISTGYSEVLKRWVSDYSFRTDFSESFGDRMILFKSNTTYRSLDSNSGADYNGFLGADQVNSSVKFVLNSQIPVQPINVSVQHNSNVIDYSQSNGVKANLLTIDIDNENGQSTSIVESNFLLENNRLYAHVLRDENSPNGIINGDHIVGTINKFLLTLKDKSQPMAINSINVEVDNVSGHS